MADPLRQTQKRYCSLAMFLAVTVGAALIISGHRPIGKGLVMGSLFSVLNFVLMAQALPHRIAHSRGKAFARSLGSILLRYVFLALPVVVAIKSDTFDLFAAVSGLFMVQVAILADHLLRPLYSTREKQV